VPWELQVVVLQAVLWELSEWFLLQVEMKLEASRVLLARGSRARLSTRSTWDRYTAEAWMIEIRKQVLEVLTVVVKKHEIHSEQLMTRRGQPEDRSVVEA
jgi:hypothetical protein